MSDDVERPRLVSLEVKEEEPELIVRAPRMRRGPWSSSGIPEPTRKDPQFTVTITLRVWTHEGARALFAFAREAWRPDHG